MSEMLSQEEIDALLNGAGVDTSIHDDFIDFTDEEKDTIGEIGNISMGTAATTLSTLLGNRVNITTPSVSILNVEELANRYPRPFVVVDVKYKEGLEGLNVLILNEDDVKIITDLMLGGPGVATPEPLTEINMSAISEAMNQMVGSASTSLSEMFSKKIDIYPPRVYNILLTAEDFIDLFPEFTMSFVKISFKMVIGDLIDSEIMQLIPLEFGKEMVDKLLHGFSSSNNVTPQPVVQSVQPVQDTTPKKEVRQQQQTQNSVEAHSTPQGNYPPQQQRQASAPVNVQPVQFQSFDASINRGVPENIELIQDVPLNVTVELGRTVKRISEILEFGPGTIIELDKLVGEALDILVNGQCVAKGEVVVIDENYGIRITDIVSPSKRFSKL